MVLPYVAMREPLSKAKMMLIVAVNIDREVLERVNKFDIDVYDAVIE